MATAYGVVTQSGGQISVSSTPGTGTTFALLLPCADPRAQAGAPQESSAEPASGSETILLVEDQAPVRDVAARILRGAGYTVLEAGDGPEALRISNDQGGAIDLVVTDVVMPGLSGPELAEALTRRRATLAVLFVSGYPGGSATRDGIRVPVSHLIQKPFSADQLLVRVRLELDARGVA